jgi:hypothetical protein
MLWPRPFAPAANLRKGREERWILMTDDQRRDESEEAEAQQQPDASDAPVDGPAPGSEGSEDEGELGSTSQDKPGGR